MQTFHDWMLLVIVAVVVAVDVLIFLVGTAIPQTRIVANLTADVEHPSFINVRWLQWLYVTMVTLLIHAEQRQCNNNNSTVVFCLCSKIQFVQEIVILEISVVHPSSPLLNLISLESNPRGFTTP